MITASSLLPTTPRTIPPLNRIGDESNASRSKADSSLQATGQNKEETNAKGLTPEEQEQVERLKKRNREVRQHEQAHLRAAGTLTQGGAQFEFTRGPDGKLYAVSGSVSLDTSKEGTPKENLEKGERIVRAAMAPADPSAEDLQVAAKGRRMQMEARQKLRRQQNENLLNQNPDDSSNTRIQNDLIEQANQIYDVLTNNIQASQPSSTIVTA